MKAVLFAAKVAPGLSLLEDRGPSPMLTLVDRPFIQHVVEYLVGQGIREFHVVLSHLPEKVEALLGDGTRWGSRFRYHLVRDGERPYSVLRTLDLGDATQRLLIGHADRLPRLPATLSQLDQAAPAVTLFVAPGSAGGDASASRWAGYALLGGDRFGALPRDADEEGFWRALSEPGPVRQCSLELVLGVRTGAELLAAQEAVLGKRFPELMLTGREVDPGVWVSRNVAIHPRAQISPPVFLGENCRVSTGCKVGPMAVIGRDCVLDTRAEVNHAVIFPGSYVGELSEVADSLVDRNRLLNVRLDAAATIADSFMLSGIAEQHRRSVPVRLVSRLAATGLLLVCWPLLLCAALALALRRRGRILRRDTVVRLPAGTDPTHWQTVNLWRLGEAGPPRGPDQPIGLGDLVLRFLPRLVNVVRGDLCVVGVEPRSAEDVLRMPADWRDLYLRTKAGLVTEAMLTHGGEADADTLYTTESFYAVSASLWYDCKILMRYIVRLFVAARQKAPVSA
jgi:NDP-sugar pyrophosphorylase family protein